MENKEQITFSLKQITTEQFAVIPDSYDDKKEELEFETIVRFGFDPDQRIVSPFIAINFRQEKKTFLILEIACHFQIVSEHWNKIYNIETQVLTIPFGIARHFVMLSVGTLRGVLHAKTENSIYNKFYLPTINVNDLVKTDVVLKTQNTDEQK